MSISQELFITYSSHIFPSSTVEHVNPSFSPETVFQVGCLKALSIFSLSLHIIPFSPLLKILVASNPQFSKN